MQLYEAVANNYRTEHLDVVRHVTCAESLVSIFCGHSIISRMNLKAVVKSLGYTTTLNVDFRMAELTNTRNPGCKSLILHPELREEAI